ncbi:hypothetical protein HK104_009697 [Borealophlyctis nickersoniae]|nr:hypothetical protein HK104_009697 [Borealophlyctis nickersoniae]
MFDSGYPTLLPPGVNRLGGKQKDDPELSLLNSLGANIWSSRGAGLVLALDCSLLILPMCRNILRILQQHLPFLAFIVDLHSNIQFHKIVAYAMLLFTLIHVNAHYTNFFKVQMDLQGKLDLAATQIHYKTYAGLTGHGMLLVMALMYSAAKIQVRMKNFELFWYTHHLYFLFYLMLFFHSYGCFVKTAEGVCKGYHSNYFTIPAFCLYLAERLIRFFRSRQQTTLTKCIVHPGNTIELRIEKPSLTYAPGQYVFLNVPAVSYFQWHPFTISSTMEEGFLSLHIRVVGDWTRALSTLVRSSTSTGYERDIRVCIDGPFGAPAQDFYYYEYTMLVCAGIGVTPAASLLKSVWYRYWRGAPMTVRRVVFVWINRDKEAFAWFKSLLLTLESSLPASFLDIQVYLTAALSPDDIHAITLNDSALPPLSAPEPAFHPLLSRSDSSSSSRSTTSTTKGGNVDPLTKLRTPCKYGRPTWPAIFAEVGRGVESGKKVGVFFCGPPAMGKGVRKAAREASSGGRGVEFVFRREHF